ncbi:MAG: nucleoside deaminase [Terriglobales bacterium]
MPPFSAADEAAMREAIAVARAGMAAGQSPFGCAIRGARGEAALLAAAHNQVWARCDPTAHAEINAIRAAAQRLGSVHLAGCTLYSTCEPCPMCLAAIHWAQIARVVYGAAIADAAAVGFNELRIPAAELVRLGGSPLAVDAGCLAADCRALFTDWRAAGGRAY